MAWSFSAAVGGVVSVGGTDWEDGHTGPGVGLADVAAPDKDVVLVEQAHEGWVHERCAVGGRC